MSLLTETIAAITPIDESAAVSAREKLAAATENPESLGALLPLLMKYIAVTKSDEPEIPKKCVIICSADHGVAELNLSAYPQSTTVEMTKNYLVSKGGVANALSNFCEAELLVVDLGIATLKENMPGLIDRRIAAGTKNFTLGPAMTREQAIKSLEVGIELAKVCAENDVKILLPGEMGICNTTTSAAICSAMTGISAEEITGYGTNISDARLKEKIAAVKKAIEVNKPDPKDGLDVLEKVGGFEFGAIAGIILGASASGALVGIDGFNCAAAALIAQSLAPASVHYLFGSQLADMPHHQKILARLGLTPCLDLKFKLGEATGSSITADMLDGAIYAYNALVRPGMSKSSGTVCVMPHVMSQEEEIVPSRAMDEFITEFPLLSLGAKEACQDRFNRLAKPIYSLGYLEEIASEYAGIIGEAKPEKNPARTLVFFSENMPERERAQLSAAFSRHGKAKTMLSLIKKDKEPAAAWSYGCELAADVADTDDLIGLAVLDDDAPQIRELISEDGSLKYAPQELIEKLPPSLKNYAAAMTGTIIGAAKNSLFIVPGSIEADIITRYVEALVPKVRPFILHPVPKLLRVDITNECGALAALGFRLLDAALYALNDMKTFAESEVSVAYNGVGKGKQGASGTSKDEQE